MSAEHAAGAIASQRVGELLDALAARTPTPGGGAVAGVTLATAAALGRMVLAFTLGKPRFADFAAAHERTAAELAEHQEACLALADADAAAYRALSAARRERPAGSSADALLPLLLAATDAPLRLLERSVALRRCLESLRGTTNPHLASDLEIAIDLADCGHRAARHNVDANLPELPPGPERDAILERLAGAAS